MSLRTWKVLGLTLSAAALGCAHQAKVALTSTPMPSVARADTSVADAERAELATLLKGAVAHFDFDQDSLTDEGQARLQKVATALKAHHAQAIRISGHCDELGTEEYNLALGQRRAQVAKKYLMALGVEPTRIDTVSFGEERPLSEAHDDEAHALNRRDELEPLK